MYQTFPLRIYNTGQILISSADFDTSVFTEIRIISLGATEANIEGSKRLKNTIICEFWHWAIFGSCSSGVRFCRCSWWWTRTWAWSRRGARSRSWPSGSAAAASSTHDRSVKMDLLIFRTIVLNSGTIEQNLAHWYWDHCKFKKNLQNLT